jgi:hypothetical protein
MHTDVVEGDMLSDKPSMPTSSLSVNRNDSISFEEDLCTNANSLNAVSVADVH